MFIFIKKERHHVLYDKELLSVFFAHIYVVRARKVEKIYSAPLARRQVPRAVFSCLCVPAQRLGRDYRRFVGAVNLSAFGIKTLSTPQLSQI